MYNAMNTIAPRPYVVKDGQGYKAEEGSEETQDSLQQGNRGNQGRQQQGNQQGQNQSQKTIARGRASDSVAAKKTFPKRPPTARRGRPIIMGANKDQQVPQTSQPIQSRPVGNHSVPQQAPRMPQQMLMAQQGMMQQRQPMPQPMQQPIQQPIQRPVQSMQQGPAPRPQPMQQPQQASVQHDEQAQKQINNMARNNKVNIAQVIKDFRGTYAAIGTPQCLVEEVESYLQDVEQHTKGEAPSINYVQTNLQNAAVILDTYISKTLDKESKVVQNWLEALFLQRINYRYNDGEINQDFLVKFPEGNTPQQPDSVVDNSIPAEKPQPELQEIPDYEPIPQPAEPVHQTVPVQPVQVHRPMPQPQPQRVMQRPPQPVRRQPVARPVAPVQVPIQKRRKPQITIIPEDNELKALFVQAKRHAYSNNPAKAMNIFQKAMKRAESINDCESQSKICYEMAKIYDDNNYLAQALSSYNKSLNVTTDTNIKTKAHYSMAKIYDDVNQVDSAINHYMTSVSYAGVEDDLSSQSKSLTNIANIYTDRYNKEAFIFYDEANVLVDQTDDAETKGYVSSNTAGAYNKFNKPDKALKCYANAVKNYSDAKVSNSVAENYKAAGELMYDLKNPAKAKILLKKALNHTDKFKDAELINQINDLLEEIG